MQTEPLVRRARDLVREDFIGDPVQVYSNNSQPLLSIIPDKDQWRLNPDLSGYGSSVMDIGVYSINTARFILDADPLRVQAFAGSFQDAFNRVPDERAAYNIVFEDGIHAACTASQNAHADSELKITGTKGQIDIRPAFHMETALTLSHGETTIEVDVEQVNQMEEVLEYFADCVLSRKTIHADGEHGLVDMRTIEAIYESARLGEAIEVPTE